MARSKKQKANDKRLGKLAKLRARLTKPRKSRQRKSNKPKRRSKSVAKSKSKSSRRARGAAGFKAFSKGYLGGNGASELSDELLTFVTVDPRIKIPVKLMSGAAGGYYTGGKIGVVGGLAAAGVDIALSLLNGKDFFNSGAAGQSRL